MDTSKANWTKSPLKKLIKLKSGITITKELEKGSGEYPFVRISDFNLIGNEFSIIRSNTYTDKFKGIERQLIPVYSIIFPKRGGAIATNKKRLTAREILIDLNTMAALCKSELDPNFFFCWFQLIDLGTLDGASSSVPQINNNDIYNLTIYYPKGIKEQQLVASEINVKLSGISKMRQAALRQKEAVEALQGALLREFFPYKKGDELPKSWKWEKLEKIFEEVKNQVQPHEEVFKTLPFVGLENVVSHTREYTDEDYNPPASTCFKFDETNILYGKLRPYLNKVFIPNNKGKSSMELIPLKTKNNYSREFLAAVLQGEAVIGNTVKFSTGGRMPRADLKKLKKLELAIPSDVNECNKLGLIVSTKIKEFIELNNKALKQLEAIEALPAAILREVFEFKTN